MFLFLLKAILLSFSNFLFQFFFQALLKADKVFDTIDPSARPAAIDVSLAHALGRVCTRCSKVYYTNKVEKK